MEARDAQLHGWEVTSEAVAFSVKDGSGDGSALNENNPQYAVVHNTGTSSVKPYEGIRNGGYLEGMAITEGASYNLSFYCKSEDGSVDAVTVSLCNEDGTVYAEQTIEGVTGEWQKFEATITPDATEKRHVCLAVEIPAGTACFDMVSLMPQDTYKGLPIRKDFGEYLEALNPKFLRFPGGCVIEGRDEESIYSWKDSIGDGLAFEINGEETVGDVAVRPQGKSIWQGSQANPYYTTYGLGFYEYFAFCEALGCMPVPVLNAGMTCEIQSPFYKVYNVTDEAFKQYVQDALDLVEFCKGDSGTKWGAVRIAMGHEEPFDLKYIGIGNEQWQSEYHQHYRQFVKAFEEAAAADPALYGDVELIVANGTAFDSTEGWAYLAKNPDEITTLVDEHYYQTPEWFLANTDRYDSYNRDLQAKVFLGEYAAKANTLDAALAEAAYMTGLEKNGDVVEMACYAPLFSHEKLNQWVPDLIFYSNDGIFGSVNYYVQQMYGNNAGQYSLETSLTGAPEQTIYESAVDALGYQAIVGKGKAIYINDVEPVSRGKLQLEGKEEEELIGAVKFGPRDAIVRVIGNLASRMDDAKVHARQYQVYMLSIVNCMTRLMQQYDLNMNEMFDGHALYEDILEGTYRREEFADKLISIACRMNEAMNQERDNTAKG